MNWLKERLFQQEQKLGLHSVEEIQIMAPQEELAVVKQKLMELSMLLREEVRASDQNMTQIEYDFTLRMKTIETQLDLLTKQHRVRMEGSSEAVDPATKSSLSKKTLASR